MGPAHNNTQRSNLTISKKANEALTQEVTVNPGSKTVLNKHSI